jgi:hypothetical protein
MVIIIVEIFEPAASRIVNLSGATILADIFAGVTRVAILVTLSVFITTPTWMMIHALINVGIRLLENGWSSPWARAAKILRRATEGLLQVDSVAWVLVVFILPIPTMV